MKRRRSFTSRLRRKTRRGPGDHEVWGLVWRFIDDFPIQPSIYSRFSMAKLNNQVWGMVLLDTEKGSREAENLTRTGSKEKSWWSTCQTIRCCEGCDMRLGDA